MHGRPFTLTCAHFHLATHFSTVQVEIHYGSVVLYHYIVISWHSDAPLQTHIYTHCLMKTSDLRIVKQYCSMIYS